MCLWCRDSYAYIEIAMPINEKDKNPELWGTSVIPCHDCSRQWKLEVAVWGGSLEITVIPVPYSKEEWRGVRRD